MRNIIDRIHYLRAKRGWSEYKLAEKSGIAQTTISAWTANDKMACPNLKSLEKIAEAFEISMSQLFADGNEFKVSEEQMEILELLASLDMESRKAIVHMLRTILCQLSR